MANVTSMVDQYDALSKLLQPPEVKEGEGKQARFDTQARRHTQVPAADTDQADQEAIAQPSGRGQAAKPAEDIWGDAEVPQQVTNLPVNDSREAPSYEFLYKQAVSTTDAFLGMMDKDASSACCEDLELRIDLPKAKGLSELDLDVQPTKILLTSPAYALSLPLPHKINEKQSSAKWIAKKKQLVLSMRIVRDC